MADERSANQTGKTFSSVRRCCVLAELATVCVRVWVWVFGCVCVCVFFAKGDTDDEIRKVNFAIRELVAAIQR